LFCIIIKKSETKYFLRKRDEFWLTILEAERPYLRWPYLGRASCFVVPTMASPGRNARESNEQHMQERPDTWEGLVL
jgi:hypothetical protein